MADDAFIDDGHTEDRFLAAVPGLHPAVRLKVRPATNAERRAYANSLTPRDPKAAQLASAKFVDAHVVDWDLPRDKTPENLAKLRPALWNRIFDVVVGA